MMESHKLFSAAVLFFAGALIIAGSVYWIFSRNAPAPATSATYTLPSPPAHIGGVVQTVGANQFTISKASAGDTTKNIPPQTGGSVVVYVSQNTLIYKNGAKKSDAQYQQEMQSFLTTVHDANTKGVVPTAPDQYEHVPLTLADLKPNMFVLITSTSADEPATSLQAQTIFVLTQP